ncbi:MULTISPECIES: efflux RND transporter periplasmic adaptor subunit [Olivibacter]|uniref:Efflux RND transporter periplasmic adaptor subunit n=1 Tax=Olivibacter jilunii TaxID=985016 RepID=A0ABW6B3A2_9SPHI
MAQRRFYYLIGVLFAIGILASCKQKTENTEASSIPVKTLHISQNKLSAQQEYIGTVESENTVDVSFLVLGTVERMFVTEGQKVSKGQILASLNKSSLQSAYNMTAASLKQAEDAHKRMTAMYQSGSLPEIKYIEIQTQLEQAKANEAIARKNLGDGTVHAPQSGVISRRYVEPGASVMPGTPIYQIMDIGTVKVKVAIPENEISLINTGSACEIKIAALNNETFQGTVIEKGVSANPISHTYDIKIKINNASGKIMPGMVGKAYLINSSVNDESTILVPVKAVQVDHTGKRFVWLKNKEGKALYKEVTLGRLHGNGVVIESGLQEGDELITEGYQNIGNGTSVIVKNENQH